MAVGEGEAFVAEYNGDLGIVRRIDQEEAELIVAFDGRDVSYGLGELDELVLAYATTIHKSQGSEYPADIPPVYPVGTSVGGKPDILR
jgi:ATP-dependent exoDNAse (exonuclease V) alpha subunit